ncbi:MAG: transketolase, partial [Gammaproteobacteria bacterium]|nr:transketolase [Gammaproteobacteria bacterium]
EKNQPSIICCKTIIGYGSPNLAGSAETHGAALGEKEIVATRAKLNWEHPPFHIPDSIYQAWDARKKGNDKEKQWQILFTDYTKQYPDLAQELQRRVNHVLPEQWTTQVNKLIEEMQNKKESIATRKASQLCIQHFSHILPELMGGSADLTASNLTDWKGVKAFSKIQPEGQYLHYGVREFGMSAIMNGLALYGGILPFGGTFLTFSDYARNAVRLAALMRQRVIFVYTHDSIGLGEDGPTHQPIEHITSLRLIPQLSVWRPCDTMESAIAWQKAIEHTGPTCLLFSRQQLPFVERDAATIANVARGGYVLRDCSGLPQIILIATGSEVALALEAAQQLAKEKMNVRVVSMPSIDVFLTQDIVYQKNVLPTEVINRIAIEAATSDSWYPFVGTKGRVIGINRYGASAPAKELFKAYGFTVEHIVSVAKEMLQPDFVLNHVASESEPILNL